ncbi:MAG: hypothetical protein E6I17_02640 [Chloroflexi bacterium]|nr:MAG: hypothetical protein E6I17_02640 [Chloroflexota bacterium]
MRPRRAAEPRSPTSHWSGRARRCRRPRRKRSTPGSCRPPVPRAIPRAGRRRCRCTRSAGGRRGGASVCARETAIVTSRSYPTTPPSFGYSDAEIDPCRRGRAPFRCLWRNRNRQRVEPHSVAIEPRTAVRRHRDRYRPRDHDALRSDAGGRAPRPHRGEQLDAPGLERPLDARTDRRSRGIGRTRSHAERFPSEKGR